MKCQNCPSPATLHITEINQSVVAELHFCEECAQLYLSGNLQEGGGALIKAADEADEAEQLVCPNCGISFKEFKQQGRLGCPHDYVVFEEELLPLLENIDNATQHVGKHPRCRPADQVRQHRLVQLQHELRGAVATEDYERAAVIRDEIQRLERERDAPPKLKD